MEFHHETVLLREATEALAPKPDGIYVDATFGGGGHSARLLSQLSPKGRLISFDQDRTAIEAGRERFAVPLADGRLTLVHDNFQNLRAALSRLDIREIDGILYDLGVSSPQFDDGSRGFSYREDARLDMRMDREASLSAYEVVNGYDFQSLCRIFSRYGEEPYAKLIARKIEASRAVAPVTTTFELTELIKSALPQKELRKKGHPAKRVFQALRIEVNHELEAAECSILQAITLLRPGGRIAVISFHSLEDRLVKQIFKEKSEVETPRGLPALPPDMKPELTRLSKKPITASEAELARNHRAHSAKLRVAQKN